MAQGGTELKIPAPTCDCRLIRLSPHWCVQGCSKNSPMHSRGPGSQAPEAGRDGVDFNLFQGWEAICIALEHVV